MQKLSKTTRRTALGASIGVVVVGAAVGVAGYANAAPTPSPAPSSTSTATAPAQPGQGRGWPGDHGAHGPRDGGMLASQLAGKLGLDQAKVATALQEVRAANKPTTKPTPSASPSAGSTPTPRDPAADDAALAKALAPRLGVDEAKIKTALDEIRAAREADRTKALDDKLAAAVKAGTLTQAEADAVKKAVDEGVIHVGGR